MSRTISERARRKVENGYYVNEIPRGSPGDVTGVPHMREVGGAEGEGITFFIYEEIDACRRACEAPGLGTEVVLVAGAHDQYAVVLGAGAVKDGDGREFRRGSFVGMDLSHDRYHLARAIMEGVAFQIVWMPDAFGSQTLKLTGGASKSRLWCQMAAAATSKWSSGKK